MLVDTDSQEYLDFKEIKANASVRVVLASLGLLNGLTTREDDLVVVDVSHKTPSRTQKDE